MNESEFNQRVAFAGLSSPRMISAARLCLLYGRRQSEAAKETGIDPAQLSRGLDRLREQDHCPTCYTPIANTL
jgi:DNA-binding MarR family transcriptional regulator